MKIFTWCLIWLLSAAQGFAQEQKNVTLTCEMTACAQAPGLYRFNGAQFVKLQIGEATDEQTYTFSVPRNDFPQFYYMGDGRNMQYVLLGTEPEVKLQGTCSDFKNLTILDSPVNQGYNDVKAQLTAFKVETNNLMRKVRFFEQRAEGEEELAQHLEALRTIDAAKVALLDSLNTHAPFLGKIAAMDTYLSYELAENKDKYLNEVDYFAREFYQFVDFQNEAYDNSPWVYESFRNFANTLASVGLTHTAFARYMDRTLNRIPRGSGAHLMALSGVVTMLRQKNHGSYAYYAEQFIQEYRDELPEATFELHAHVQSVKDLQIGGEAPDFTQQTPEGESLSLSDLRGKVVLLDFWASWCGPCRRENPNVVKVYEKYKDKGFEILGISLDRDRDRWLQAIKQDGLTWKHVSDLKYWSNAVAKQYNVRAIPHTILVDAEGKIIARNLRGAQLEQALAEMFE